jgi:hypothetical protein
VSREQGIGERVIGKRVLLIILFLLMASCSSWIPADTGIEGQVFIGPTCPVVQADNPCPDKAYQATLTILNSAGRKITRFTTDDEGRFQVPLAPGNYILRPETPAGQPMPVAAEQPFGVIEGQFTQLKVTFDSGIR